MAFLKRHGVNGPNKQNENMKLEINDNTSLMQVQEQFNKAYQYLQIDFYYTSFYTTSDTSPEKINKKVKIKNISNVTKTSIINIDKNVSIHQLEEDFFKIFGLKVKIYRKSGNVWVETTFTGNWSLERQ